MNVKLDFSEMTSLTSRDSELVMTRQDGNAIGTLNDFSIGTDGKITGSFTNGQTRTLGQVAIATFANPLGLQDDGNNMYSTGVNSGPSVRQGAAEKAAVLDRTPDHFLQGLPDHQALA
jgi:flagellar hook protein FlgE